MIGAIAGDVLGSVYEAQSTRSKSFRLFHELDRPTDDSVLTIAVAAALLDAADASPPRTATVEDYARHLRAFGLRYPNAGYGGSFRRWVNAAPSTSASTPYNSWGNGSAMRVSAIGWALDTEDTVLRHAECSALPTHNHPEGVKGAQAVALAVLLARRGASKEVIREQVSSRFAYDLHRTVDSLRAVYQYDVTCQGSVPEAIIAFLDSTGYEDAIRNAISLGGDADTQACIAGAIAEAHYGTVPAHILAWVLPRLDDQLLAVVNRFLCRFGSATATAAVEQEIAARHTALGGRRGDRTASNDHGRAPRQSLSHPYTILLHHSAWERFVDYANRLASDRSRSGGRLRAALGGLPGDTLDTDWLLSSLLATKRPRIFAESEIIGDGSDWTQEELRLLGDVSIAVPVTVFDDGRHHAPPVHHAPFAATLLFVPGALLRSDRGTPADWNEVVRNDAIDQARYEALCERRLLPALRYASATAVAAGQRTIVTIPGLGCGQFAGPFLGKLGTNLRNAVESILRRNVASLCGIGAVWFDPYDECEIEQIDIGPISLFVRPLRKAPSGLPQLSTPAAFAHAVGSPNLADCTLSSVVAWDHVSWPGNDFFAGARSTDDGVKAAATDSMFWFTGFRGHYDPSTHTYNPPEGVSTWESLVTNHQLTLTAINNVMVVRPDVTRPSGFPTVE